MIKFDKNNLELFNYEIITPKRIFNEHSNITTRFLWPLTNECFHEDMKALENKYFLQCYYEDNLNINKGNEIFILLQRPIGNIHYRRLHKLFIKSPNFIKFYFNGVLNNNYTYIYILKINEKYINDFNLIIEGKYSKISEFAKSRILNFNKRKNLKYNNYNQITDTVYSVLYKTDYVKKTIESVLDIKLDKNQEYWTKYDKNIETLNIKHL